MEFDGSWQTSFDNLVVSPSDVLDTSTHDRSIILDDGNETVALVVLPEYPYRVREVSTSLSEILGFSEQELRTMRSLEGPRTKLQSLKSVIQNLLEGQQTQEQIVLYCKDGSDIACTIQGLSTKECDGVLCCKLALITSSPYAVVSDIRAESAASTFEASPQKCLQAFSSVDLDPCFLVHLNAMRRRQKSQ
jgi:hypothetical protein